MENIQLWTTLSNILFNLVGVIALGHVCWAIRNWIIWIQTKIQDMRYKSAVKEFQQVINNGVLFTEQTMVSAFKDNGCWDEDSRRQTLVCCTNYVLTTLNEETKDILIEDNKSSIEQLVRTNIEAEICRLKTLDVDTIGFSDIPSSALDTLMSGTDDVSSYKDEGKTEDGASGILIDIPISDK